MIACQLLMKLGPALGLRPFLTNKRLCGCGWLYRTALLLLLRLRLLLRQWLLRRQQRDEPLRYEEEGARQKPDGGRVMARTFKALSALLSYPTDEIRAASIDHATPKSCNMLT